MSIPNNLLVKLAMQDITSTNSVKTAEPIFNTLFDTKNITNFYAIGLSSLLAHQHFKKHKNASIKGNMSQLSDDLVPEQKQEILRYVRSKKIIVSIFFSETLY